MYVFLFLSFIGLYALTLLCLILLPLRYRIVAGFKLAFSTARRFDNQITMSNVAISILNTSSSNATAFMILSLSHASFNLCVEMLISPDPKKLY